MSNISPYVISSYLTTKDKVSIKCPKCNNIKICVLSSHLQILKKNNGKYLCHKCSIDRNKSSQMMLNKWKDKEYANKILANLRSEKMKNIIVNKNKRCFSDNNWVSKWKKSINRELISQKSKEMWSDSNFRKRISRSFSIRCKKQWLDPEFRKKMIDYRNTDRYKSKMLDIRQQMAISKSSKQQNILYELLDDLNVVYTKEASIGYYLFDCLINPQPKLSINKSILIEVNGDYWHSLPKSVRNDRSKSTYINRYFPQYIIKYIWEHEFIAKDRVLNILRYWLGLDKLALIQFDINQISERIIDSKDAEKFIGKYHYSGKLGRSGINIGYFINEILIAVVIYSFPIRKEVCVRLGYNYNDVKELSRFVIHPQYQHKNIGSFIISKSIRYIKKFHNNIKCLVSFADSTYNHIGTIYKASNWKFDGIVEPDYWYVDKDGYICHKKTLWDKSKEMRMTENEYCAKYGYLKVWGGEKFRYVFDLCV